MILSFNCILKILICVCVLCRWDSPLINLQLDDVLPAEEIRKAIFEVAAPVPNQSTINVRVIFKPF